MAITSIMSMALTSNEIIFLRFFLLMFYLYRVNEFGLIIYNYVVSKSIVNMCQNEIVRTLGLIEETVNVCCWTLRFRILDRKDCVKTSKN